MGTRRWVLTPLITTGFSLALLLFLAAGRAGFHAQSLFAEAGDQVDHTLEVLDRTRRVRVHMIDAEAEQRGYLLTGRERDLSAYEAATNALPADLERLGKLIEDDPDQRRRLTVLTREIAEELDELARTIAIRRREGLPRTVRRSGW